MHREFAAFSSDFTPRTADLQTARTTRPLSRPVTYAFGHPATYETAIPHPTSHHQHTYNVRIIIVGRHHPCYTHAILDLDQIYDTDSPRESQRRTSRT